MQSPGEELDKITFFTQDRREDFDFPTAHVHKRDNMIYIDPIKHPKNDIRQWDIIASKDGDVKVDGRVTKIEQNTTMKGGHGMTASLEIHYVDKL